MHSGKAEGKTANSVIQKEHPNFLCIHNLKRKKLLTFDFIENREKKNFWNQESREENITYEGHSK